MPHKLYVGNLNYATTEESLASLFSRYGEVYSSSVVRDRTTDMSKGFGFIEMAEGAAADAACADLNGREFEGRRIRVDIARERPVRRSFGGDRLY